MTAKASASQSAVRLGPEIRARIGRQLRALYDDVVNQGVPDKFADMLKNLNVSPGDKEDK
jgi:hypothetical protein